MPGIITMAACALHLGMRPTQVDNMADTTLIVSEAGRRDRQEQGD